MISAECEKNIISEESVDFFAQFDGNIENLIKNTHTECFQIIDSGLIRERRSLSEEGLVMILYRIGRDGALIAKPTIETRGFIYIKNSQEFIDFAREKASDLYYDYFDKKMDISIQRYISNEFSTYLSDVLDRYPIVMPIFIKPEDDFIMTKRDRNVREEWKEKQAVTK